MGKLFYSGTIERIVRQRLYMSDKRKKVKLVHLVTRSNKNLWYVFVGAKLVFGPTNSRSAAESKYDRI